MLVEWRANDAGQYGLFSVPDEYDARCFPQAFLVDREPRLRSVDRLAIAAVLLFGDRIDGRLDIGGSVTPLVATTIEECYPTVRLPKVDFVPRALPQGSGSLRLRDEDSDRNVRSAVGQLTTSPRRTTMVVRRSDLVAGASIGVDEVTVPSNGWLFADDAATRLAMLAAHGVLYAEDFGAAELEMDQGDLGSHSAHQRVSRLLASTGLLLSTESGSHARAEPAHPS